MKKISHFVSMLVISSKSGRFFQTLWPSHNIWTLIHCFNHKCTLSKAQEHMAEVTTAMLYFACGGMDESHNIVLSHRYTMGPKMLWSSKIYLRIVQNQGIEIPKWLFESAEPKSVAKKAWLAVLSHILVSKAIVGFQFSCVGLTLSVTLFLNTILCNTSRNIRFCQFQNWKLCD